MSPKGLDLPKEITKFLVFNDNPKYLRYIFGKYDMYVDSIVSIADRSAHGQFQRPAVVTVQYKDEMQIDLLLANEKRMMPRRIFKSVWKRPKSREKIDAFLMNCAKNLLNLVPGKILRIYCKDDHELQQKAYEIFMKVNDGDNLGCKFDYDVYDMLFWIKEYVATQKPKPAIIVDLDSSNRMRAELTSRLVEDKHWFITSVEGELPKQLPNPFSGKTPSKPYEPLA